MRLRLGWGEAWGKRHRVPAFPSVFLLSRPPAPAARLPGQRLRRGLEAEVVELSGGA